MALTKKEQVDEIMKCGEDPIYFIRKYLYIQHPLKGRLPFDLYPFQEECIEAFLNYKFTIALKSRQLGMSTTISAYCLWMAMFRRDANILIMATKLDVSKFMIQKIRTTFKMLPSWMLSLLDLKEPEAESVKYIKFNNGGKITAIPTSVDAGRGEAVTLLIVDEAAHVENFQELWLGLYPTLSTGGRAIIFSTPKGKNFFYQMWAEADTGVLEEGRVGQHCKGVGKNGFHGIKLPWFVHPERDEKWFEDQAKPMDARGIAQELLCGFEGSTLTFFSQACIDYVRNLSQTPIGFTGPNNKGQDLHIWKTSVPDHKYVISADVARGDAEDYSTFHVFDTNTSEVVAEYMGKIPPDRFGEWLVEIGKRYNTALIVNEKNTVGIATAIKLRDAEYPNVYYDLDLQDKMLIMTPDEKKDVLPGFTISPKNREKILENLEQVIRNQQLKIYSLRFVSQMETFIWNGKRGQALKKRHDDLIMAMAIGLQIFTPSAAQEGYLGMQAASQSVAMSMLKGMSRGFKDINSKFNGKPIPFGVRRESIKLDQELRKEFWWLYS
jgi:Terminase large subunit, T4likevirus-type, N-terminal